jgi:cytochrome c biogenesis protein CcmG/thiol:disulfide interchange protein DsbE
MADATQAPGAEPLPPKAGATADCVQPDETAPAKMRAVVFWQIGIAAIVILFLGFLAWRLVETNRSEQRASGEAPAFAFTTFDGESIALADLAGKGVVLNFWASWCDPCRDEANLLETAWQREQANDVVFIGLDYLDQEPAAKAYLDEFAISYPSGPDLQSEAARRYGIKGVPETFFIDPDGNITDIVIGPIVDESTLEHYLSKIRPAAQ